MACTKLQRCITSYTPKASGLIVHVAHKAIYCAVRESMHHKVDKAANNAHVMKYIAWSTHTSTYRYLLCWAGSISFPSGLSELNHTTYIVSWPLIVPTWNTPRFASWNLASSWCQPANPHQTPWMLSPTKLSKSVRGAPGPGAPGSGAPGYGRTWVHLIAISKCGL